MVSRPARGVGAQQPLGAVSLGGSAWLQTLLAEGLGEQGPCFFPGVALFWGESGKLWVFIKELEQEVGEVK